MLAPILIFDIPSSGSGGPLMDWVLHQNKPYVLFVRNKTKTLHLLSEEAQLNVTLYEFQPFTTEAVQTHLNQLGINKIAGVICAIDALLPVASQIAQLFACAFAMPDVIDLWRDKGLGRQFCKQRGFSVPDFAMISSTHLDDIKSWSKFPAIIKPRRGAGGLGVKRVDRLIDIQQFFAERKGVFNSSDWMIEALLSGPIFSVEGYVCMHHIKVLGISDRTWGLQPYFVEEG
ncbi:MAG: hypothetical protein FGM54_07040, partial [Chitinophagaceae bacterium]|nr:hypothetical protein [Chitinophagaceae bacterium]